MRARQPKSWILLISLCCALIYAALQYSPRDMALINADTKIHKQFPQSYMKGIVDRTYDNAGKLKHKMIARSAQSFSDGTVSNNKVEQPEVTIYRQANAAPWQLSAKQGTSYAGTITLQDDVLARNEQDRYGLITLTTAKLTIDTEQQFAHTDKPVTMRSERGTTRAVGLNAELDNGRIELLSEVKATYAP
ncbi:LPS export ABC transporter periplasmic protein LptC [Gilvimarinus polysaccharolyticus]|uniref:LPS export ABC transporter periplasmic protein LptC n=1 Tax=Gilvimarinus polysaccharolyticus TaxID=863921 RepID=UPI0006732053|nr:LPS export ABC transporter periplasmic protein LptC [Gilvimarinus polysaccharolyticus]